MDCLHKVYALVVLDSDGKRLFGKYYGANSTHGGPSSGGGASAIAAPIVCKWPTIEAQSAFESAIHAKTRGAGAGASAGSSTSAEGDVLLHDGSAVVFLCDPELTFAVVGGADENELVLAAVLSCLYEALQQLLGTVTCITKRELLTKYDLLWLVADEMIDDGIILETSSAAVVAEVQPFAVVESQAADGAKKALTTLNKLLKESL